MYNFFVENNNITADKAIIIEDYNHLVNVLRKTIGDKIYVCNKESGKSYLVEISEITKTEVICDIIEENTSTESNLDITVFQGLPKAEKMETIIQKCTELGANRFVPVNKKYCISKLKDDKKIDRWQKIAEVAAKQSKRNIIPKVENLITMEQLKNEISEYDLVLIAYENERKTNIKEVIKQNPNAERIGIVIGPEGGMSIEEVKNLEECGAKTVGLGKRILRTETAPITMISMLIYEYEF